MPRRFGNGAIDQMVASANFAVGIIGAWDRDIRRNIVSRTMPMTNLDIPAGVECKSTFEEYLTIVHPLDRDRVRRVRNDALESGGEYRCVYRLMTRTGVKTISARGRCYKNQRGEPLRFVGVFMEVAKDDLNAGVKGSLDRMSSSVHEMLETCDEERFPIVVHLLRMLLLELSNPHGSSIDHDHNLQ